MNYNEAIKELQAEQVDIKKLNTTLAASYIALCKFVEKTAEYNEQNKKELEEFKRAILELEIQQKVIVEDNGHLLQEIKELKKRDTEVMEELVSLRKRDIELAREIKELHLK